MENLISTVVAWLAEHSTLAGLAVFFLNVGESLVVIGLFIPGVIVMFAIGALVAVGALDLWATLAWAVAGAVVGDGVSFWIGRRYREQLRGWWPFTRHPEWFDRAEVFFHRHGGKSVLFGRFAGPVRPIIPAVAGMLGMPPYRFYLVNLLSAVTWAPAYILPGVVLGASLTLASEVASRLAILVVLLVAALWLTYAVVRRAYLLLAPRLERALLGLLGWGKVHPALRGVTDGVLDPTHPDLRALLELAATLVLGTWLFASLLGLQLGHPAPFAADYQVNYLFERLRSPWADQVMVALALAADAPVNLTVLACGLGWLLWQRHWPAAAHWVGAVAVAGLVAVVLNHALPLPRPRPDLNVGVADLAFPSAHLTLVSALYGFLAVLLAGAMPERWRRLPYTLAGLWLVSIGLAHLYLARHWMSDVVAGSLLGLAWTALVGIAYRRHATRPVAWRGLALVTGLTLAIGGLVQIALRYETSLVHYAPHRTERTLATSAWWDWEWASLPARRIDWEGQPGTPLTLQWAGGLRELAAQLDARGWQAPVPIEIASVLRWLTPSPSLNELPVLPQVHDGRQEALIRVLPESADSSDTRLVLRLWPADVVLEPGKVPVWLGSLSRQRIAKTIGLLQVPRSEPLGDQELSPLVPFLDGREWRLARRAEPASSDWDGAVLLLVGTER